MEAVWELFDTAVRMPRQQDRQAMKDLAVRLADTGGLSDMLMGTKLDGPYLTAASLRAELEEVRTALQAEQSHGPEMAI